MPQVKLGLCLFHTLRTFKREVTTSKLGITEEERDSLQILQSLAYAKSPDEYENLHRKLLNEAPRSVLDYFTKNWHPLKEEWVLIPILLDFNFYCDLCICVCVCVCVMQSLWLIYLFNVNCNVSYR